MANIKIIIHALILLLACLVYKPIYAQQMTFLDQLLADKKRYFNALPADIKRELKLILAQSQVENKLEEGRHYRYTVSLERYLQTLLAAADYEWVGFSDEIVGQFRRLRWGSEGSLHRHVALFFSVLVSLFVASYLWDTHFLLIPFLLFTPFYILPLRDVINDCIGSMYLLDRSIDRIDNADLLLRFRKKACENLFLRPLGIGVLARIISSFLPMSSNLSNHLACAIAVSILISNQIPLANAIYNYW